MDNAERLEPGIWSLRRTADYLQVHEETVRKLADRAELASVRIGRRRFISAESVLAFVARGGVK